MTMEQNRAPTSSWLLTRLVMGSLLLASCLPAQDLGNAAVPTSGGATQSRAPQDPEGAIDLLMSDLPTLPVARANEKFQGALQLSGLNVAEFIGLLAGKEFLDINVILGASGPALDSPINIELNDITMGEAFNLVLQLNRLRAVRFNQNTFIIVDAQDNRTFGVKTRKVFHLTYVSTKAVVDFISENPNLKNLVDLDNVVQDTNNNALLVIDSPDRIRLISHVVSLLDAKPNKLTVRIPVSHIKLEDITNAIGNLPAEVQDRLNPDEMIFSEQGRTLIVYDTPEDVGLLRDIIRQIDIGLKQVLIDVSIMEVSETVARNIGLSLRSGQIEVSSLDKLWNLDRIRGEIQGDPANADDDVFPTRTQLNYTLQSQGGNTIANPKIRVVDQESASINVGQVRNVRVQTSEFSGNTTGGTQQTTFNTQEVPVGVTLSATPQVHNDGTVTLELDIQDEEIISISEFGVDRTTRNSNTTLRMRDGETVILGGFINRNISFDKTPFPILGQIPLLKKIFRTNSRSKVASELIILLTPYILDYDPVVPRTEVEVVPPGKPVSAKNYGYSDTAASKAKVKTTTTRWTETDDARTKVIYDAQGEIIYQRTFPKDGPTGEADEPTSPLQTSDASAVAVPPPLAQDPTPATPTKPAELPKDSFADLRQQSLQAPALPKDDFSDLLRQPLAAPGGDAPVMPPQNGATENWEDLMRELGSLAGGG